MPFADVLRYNITLASRLHEEAEARRAAFRKPR